MFWPVLVETKQGRWMCRTRDFVEHSKAHTHIIHDQPAGQIHHFFCHQPKKLPGPVLLSKPTFQVMRPASQAKASMASRPDKKQSQRIWHMIEFTVDRSDVFIFEMANQHNIIMIATSMGR
jgi:hypothetical protein